MTSPTDARATTNSAVPDISPDELDRLLSIPDAPPLLLDLWAPWCQPCLAQAPALERLAAVTAGRLRLAKLDTQKFPEVAKALNVRGIPLLVLFLDGREVDRRTGKQSFEQLCIWMDEFGGDDVLVDASAPAFRSPPPLGGAFYGDEGLRRFLLDRCTALAEAGLVDNPRFPVWGGDRGSVSAALVRSDDPLVFSRVTALPAALGLCLHFANIATPDDLREVFDAIPAGADVRGIAPRLLLQWLSDDTLPWSSHLDAEADGLRLDWIALTQEWLHGEPPLPAAWDSLAGRARALGAAGMANPLRVASGHFGLLLGRASPPPAEDDPAWPGLLLLYGTYQRVTLAYRQQGWTDTQLAHEVVREHWFRARCADPTELTAEQLQDLRACYEAECGEAEAAQDRLIAATRGGFDTARAAGDQRLRTQLIASLAAIRGA
ncbi:thioredoxin family protein [Roseateles sp.]|uniref:thioredoxin family protein n=1 Tax=Roseateles sp. TaxID=1971397 RepID=UPI0039EC57BC